MKVGFSTIVRKFFKDELEYIETLKLLKRIVINDNTGFVTAYFKSSKDENKEHETIVDLCKFKYVCSCENAIYNNKVCKHIRLATLLGLGLDKIKLTFLKHGNFTIEWIKGDKLCKYYISKGKLHGIVVERK